MAERFDAAYFQRFYESKRTRVYGKKEVADLASGVVGFLGWFHARLDAVLEIGAGVGMWRDWFGRHRPAVRYVSTDTSAYACERYGHVQRDIAKWRGRERFDLVVCQGVLPYLDDDACATALANIAAMCRGFLYVEAITRQDLREVCDQSRTDGAVRVRSGAWYRRELGRQFMPVGCGLHYMKSGPLAFYELEAAPRRRSR
jgi:hypothetical protein